MSLGRGKGTVAYSSPCVEPSAALTALKSQGQSLVDGVIVELSHRNFAPGDLKMDELFVVLSRVPHETMIAVVDAGPFGLDFLKQSMRWHADLAVYIAGCAGGDRFDVARAKDWVRAHPQLVSAATREAAKERAARPPRPPTATGPPRPPTATGRGGAAARGGELRR